MDAEITRRRRACDSARNPSWETIVSGAKNLGDAEIAYMRLHPPGLVGALWSHFEATRDKCECQQATHERPDCAVRLIERILVDDEFL